MINCKIYRHRVGTKRIYIGGEETFPKYTKKCIQRLLNTETRDKPFVVIDGGRLLLGSKCAALTPSGIKYNRLIRLIRLTRGL